MELQTENLSAIANYFPQMNEPLRLVFLGPPGSGKGSQANFVVQHYGIDHISTGELLREATRNETTTGKMVSEIMSQGSLVPDDIVLQLICDYLDSREQNASFLLDGFPRSLNQGEELKAILAKHSCPLHLVIHFHIDSDAVIKRLSGRRNCVKCARIYNIYFDPPKTENQCDDCGSEGQLMLRSDDNEESIQHRLEVYGLETEPLLDYYQNERLLHTIDASGSVSEIADATDIAIQSVLSTD